MRPLGVVRIGFDKGKHQLRVFVWKELDDLRAAGAVLGIEDAEQAYGFYNPRAVHIETIGMKIITKFVGEIHLVENYYGSGLFAHELQHFMQDWASIYKAVGGNDNEYLPDIAGSITSTFWDWHYMLSGQFAPTRISKRKRGVCATGLDKECE